MESECYLNGKSHLLRAWTFKCLLPHCFRDQIFMDISLDVQQKGRMAGLCYISAEAIKQCISRFSPSSVLKGAWKPCISSKVIGGFEMKKKWYSSLSAAVLVNDTAVHLATQVKSFETFTHFCSILFLPSSQSESSLFCDSLCFPSVSSFSSLILVP